ncbi:hypothetical protein Patl1_05024 [Pistacia atlantica]|uniref:Uncharacterized protein n=1 Tax=Pistacia atlantica TaxID=434234 RepID=A0ACC1BV18_9ROSI|nr:hypothetical protein Patl1_05024 [Pistacia atlantica]
MSLLEESHCEEYDKQQLENLIRSLEAEINPKTVIIEDQESVIEGQDCSESSLYIDDYDFAWDNIELVTSSSISSDEFNLYMDSCNQMDGIVDFGGVSDDNSQLYYGCCSSAWHETDDIMICQ